MEPQMLMLTAGLLLALLTALLALLRVSGRAGRASRARNARAQLGEQAAVEVLEDWGYRVVARQETGVAWMSVDSEAVEFEVRADFIVAAHGERYVAEVKTGELATDPCYPPTRRQLREYAEVFGLPVLLVDPERRTVEHVEFGEIEGVVSLWERTA